MNSFTMNEIEKYIMDTSIVNVLVNNGSGLSRIYLQEFRK